MIRYNHRRGQKRRDTINMKKAERIFIQTLNECKEHINSFGFERNPDGKAVGYTTLCTEESVCARTLNEVRKVLKRNLYNLTIDYTLDIYDKDTFERKAQALEMVSSTIENHRKNIEAFEEA